MTRPPSHHFPKPPRLLLGVALLGWGGFAGHPLIALATAFLVEGAHWLKWRWDFEGQGYSQAWILSLIILAGTVGYYSLNLASPTAILSFIGWLPLIFLPLLLAQQYGQQAAVPTTIFSVIARQRLKRERLLGKEVPETRIHLGYPYFALVLIAAGFSVSGTYAEMRGQWQFFALLLLLSGAAFYYCPSLPQRRLIPWLVMILLVGMGSFASSQGLVELSKWVQEGGFFRGKEHHLPIEQNTAIGRLGELKLSRSLQWRVMVPPGKKPPERLMTLAYNNFRSNKWQALDPDYSEIGRSYSDLLTTVDKKDAGEFAFETEGFAVNDQPRSEDFPIRIVGAVNSNRKALPSPAAPVLIAQAHEIDSLERSQLGTLLAINASNVVDYEVWTGEDPSLRESPPLQQIRNGQLRETTALTLPASHSHSATEQLVLKDLVAELKLPDLDDRNKVRVLRKYFQENFRYTTHLKIAANESDSALVQFLATKREGHCEYFATATTLLLRAAGVPAHYVVGFAVREESNRPGEYLLRGTHAHAWCRAYLGGRKETMREERSVPVNGSEKMVTFEREVWVGGQWTDVDLTPVEWFAVDSPPATIQEQLSDSLQRLREDFQLWRAEESNRNWVNLALVVIGAAVAAFVVWRLSTSRVLDHQPEEDSSSPPEGPRTLLNEALDQLEASLGPRPVGALLSDWLPQTIPEYPASSYAQLFELHDSLRFGEGQLTPRDAENFQSLVGTLHNTCTQMKEGSF